jgi:hypothetical protein
MRVMQSYKTFLIRYKHCKRIFGSFSFLRRSYYRLTIMNSRKFFSDFLLKLNPSFSLLNKLVLHFFKLRLNILCFLKMSSTKLGELSKSVGNGIGKIFNLNKKMGTNWSCYSIFLKFYVKLKCSFLLIAP